MALIVTGIHSSTYTVQAIRLNRCITARIVWSKTKILAVSIKFNFFKNPFADWVSTL